MSAPGPGMYRFISGGSGLDSPCAAWDPITGETFMGRGGGWYGASIGCAIDVGNEGWTGVRGDARTPPASMCSCGDDTVEGKTSRFDGLGVVAFVFGVSGRVGEGAGSKKFTFMGSANEGLGGIASVEKFVGCDASIPCTD